MRYYVPVDDGWEEVLGHNVYIKSQYFSPNAKIELHRPGIEPGLPAWHAGTLPKELSTVHCKKN